MNVVDIVESWISCQQCQQYPRQLQAWGSIGRKPYSPTGNTPMASLSVNPTTTHNLRQCGSGLFARLPSAMPAADKLSQLHRVCEAK